MARKSVEMSSPVDRLVGRINQSSRSISEDGRLAYTIL